MPTKCQSPACDRAAAYASGFCPGHEKRRRLGQPTDTPLRGYARKYNRTVTECPQCGAARVGAECGACAKAAKKEAKEAAALAERVRYCAWCGGGFIPEAHGQKRYCARECQRDANKAAYREWERNTPQGRERKRERRHRRRGAGGTVPAADWAAILDWCDYRCVYCGAPWEHRDHVYPIALGGTNTPDNVLPACQDCNQDKRDRDPLEWWGERREKVA